MNKRQQGSSLIEVLIALLVVSFSISGIVTLHININRMSTLAQNKHQALYLAESELEKIRLNALSGNISEASLSWVSEAFTLTRTVMKHSALSYVMLVEVTVSWKDSSQNDHSILLRTQFYLNNLRSG